MAKFGWAYIDCSGSSSGGGSGSAGPNGALQFVTASGPGHTTGSAKLIYHTSSNTLFLTGTLIVSGTVEANNYDIITTTVTEIDMSGNTNFGDTNSDTHIFTGSLSVMSSSTYLLSASVPTNTVHVRGFAGNYTNVLASPYTLNSSDYILGVQMPNYVTMSLPAPTADNRGQVYIIKDEVNGRGTGSIFITGAVAGFSIDHTDSYVMTGSNPAISLYSNGSNWFVF